jgi:hypothetical protein
MLLSEMLSKFATPTEAAKVAGLGRTAGWHWYQDGERRTLPSVRTLVIWSDHFGLSDVSLGELIRDANRQRLILTELHKELRAERKRGKIAASRRRAGERRAMHQAKLESDRLAKFDESVDRAEDWSEKEAYLQEKARKERIEVLRAALLKETT